MWDLSSVTFACQGSLFLGRLTFRLVLLCFHVCSVLCYNQDFSKALIRQSPAQLKLMKHELLLEQCQTDTFLNNLAMKLCLQVDSWYQCADFQITLYALPIHNVSHLLQGTLGGKVKTPHDHLQSEAQLPPTDQMLEVIVALTVLDRDFFFPCRTIVLLKLEGEQKMLHVLFVWPKL